MKTWRRFIGTANLALAGVAVYAAITHSDNPIAFYGYLLAVAMGTQGLLYLLTEGE